MRASRGVGYEPITGVTFFFFPFSFFLNSVNFPEIKIFLSIWNLDLKTSRSDGGKNASRLGLKVIENRSELSGLGDGFRRFRVF